MPVLCPLYVLIEGDINQSINHPDILREIYKFQRFMRDAFIGTGRVMFTQSVVATFPAAQYIVKEGNPNWFFFPVSDQEVQYSFRRTIYGVEPGDIDKYLDGDERYTTSL